jgi:hypothetical protein
VANVTREESIQFLTGQRAWPQNDTNRWGLFRNPLPPASEHAVFRDIRNDGRLETREVLGPRFDEVGPDVRRDFLQDFGALSERHNPIVRRVVRRTRPMLEERGLLKRIGVIAHPRAGDAKRRSGPGGKMPVANWDHVDGTYRHGPMACQQRYSTVTGLL